jgi:succinyl-CoA synthetase beta subunit
VARSAHDVRKAVLDLDSSVVLKVQAWVTGRAAQGGVRFADTPDEATAAAEEMFDLRFGQFPIEEILVERIIDISREFFVSITIDDALGAPVLLLDPHGGSGIEERAAGVSRMPVDPRTGTIEQATLRASLPTDLPGEVQDLLIDTLSRLPSLAKAIDARSLEINPLAITRQGEIVAADCRITIDDYAVFRRPELGIEIARELDHPPTELEKLAYRVEQSDHRGTFYFMQLAREAAPGSRGLIGFHGAGGGGSMMSMDAVTSAGFTLANFCDTSGNPSAAKVYRAARIILAQPGIVGYFGSGSGVASQEQFWSAYGLAKAFNEVRLNIPAVIRLGGNSEDRAVEILEDACRNLPAPVEGYKKDDTPQSCAEHFATLVAGSNGSKAPQGVRNVPQYVDAPGSYSFAIQGGRVWIDHARCDEEAAQIVLRHSSGLFVIDPSRKPVLAVPVQEAASKDSEFIACEIECLRAGAPVVFVDLDLLDLSSA